MVVDLDAVGWSKRAHDYRSDEQKAGIVELALADVVMTRLCCVWEMIRFLEGRRCTSEEPVRESIVEEGACPPHLANLGSH